MSVLPTPATANQALQRTAPAVTLAAPPPSPTQPSRQPPPSLSLGSFGRMNRFLGYSKSDWLEAIGFILFATAIFFLPHASKWVRFPAFLFIGLGTYYALFCSLRDTWRAKPNARSFLGYYATLFTLGAAILVSLILIFGIFGSSILQ